MGESFGDCEHLRCEFVSMILTKVLESGIEDREHPSRPLLR